MKKLLSITLSIIMLISAMAFIAPTPARAETLAQNTPTMRALRADEISPYVDATTALSHGHVARVPAEEDLNTIVYRNLDGTKTAYFFDYNVKYVDENGVTQDKDITLAAKSGGYDLTKSDISLTIPTDITSGVEFTHNGNYIKLTPVRENIIGESLSQATAALNKPQSAVKNSAKNEISYQKAFGNGTSLRYVPTMDGVKEEIILSSYNGTNQWRFVATTNGLTPYLDSNGTYYFAESEDSDEKYSLGNVYTYDSAGNYTYGTMTVTEVKPAQQYIITLNVDEEFLTADSTVYPVYVDPSITVPSTSIEDTAVYSNTPSTNYGNNESMYIGYYNNSTYGRSRVLMRMQSLINNGTFHNYADIIESATLTLNFEKVSSELPISIHMVNNINWTENGATWNNASSYNSTVLKSFTPNQNSYGIDIKSIVSSWKVNQSYLQGGLMLMIDGDTALSSNSYYKISSTEGGDDVKPTLTIQYRTNFSKYFYSSVDVYESARTSIVKSIPNGATVAYESQNNYVTTVDEFGVVTGKFAGSTTVIITLTINEEQQPATCIVNVIDCPDDFKTLFGDSKLYNDEFVSTDDGFYMMTVPISTLCSRYNISISNTITGDSVANTSDIFLYRIVNGVSSANGVVILKTENTSSSKVSISFIAFDYSKLTDCITLNTPTNVQALENELGRVLTSSNSASTTLSDYFSEVSSDASYLIAETYIEKIVERTFVNNSLTLSAEVTTALANTTNNKKYNMKAALDVYDTGSVYTVISNNGTDLGKITVANVDSLSYNAKNIILMSHTGNTSFHAFAAEVKYHADRVNYPFVGDNARIADMSIKNYKEESYNFAHNTVLGNINNLVEDFVEAHTDYDYAFGEDYRW